MEEIEKEGVTVLNTILTETVSSGITLPQLILCTLTSLGIGIVLAFLHTYKNTSSKNFVMTLAILPAVVQAVIMLVNGNLGTGVAVMGAFGLVRFRSAPGNAREIGSVFLAMAIGLATGMGYLGIAVLLLLIIGAAILILTELPFGSQSFSQKELKVTIPENLDYAGIFDDLFEKYTKSAELMKVRTTNMGSLYELCYRIELKKEEEEKTMLDDIRCRNGNLTIVCGRIAENREEL
ncbi:Uncharacterised protein [Hungatella hathewayi]|nr:Uncharacterised protein [Hungatella hathewayi]